MGGRGDKKKDCFLKSLLLSIKTTYFIGLSTGEG